ncbi:hypothetical protein D3C72_1764120 [compost metagenome]
MAGCIGAVVPDRLRGGAPDLEAVLVADIDSLAARVRNSVIGPGRQLVVAAVLRPGAAAAAGRRLEAKAGIRDHIDPWGRGRPLGVLHHDIFPAVLIEATQAVEELEPGLRRHRRQ